MSLFPFSTNDRKDAEIPVSRATSLNDSDFVARACRSTNPRRVRAGSGVEPSLSLARGADVRLVKRAQTHQHLVRFAGENGHDAEDDSVLGGDDEFDFITEKVSDCT